MQTPEQYPNGATVRDRLGRLVLGVVACNTETGEVIKGTMAEGGRVETHQTWPAPLTIEPRQWLHIGFGQWGRDRPPLPVLDDRTPEEICGYGDDGLCSH